MAKASATKDVQVSIKAPTFGVAEFAITGNAPYVQAKFSQKARNVMKEKHEKGGQAKRGAAKEARDFNADYEGAMYRDEKGRLGIPANAFRAAMISACRLVGAKMTIGKMTLFVEADTFDAEDGTPLVLIKGKQKMDVRPVRNATGVADLRARPMWMPGWTARLRIRYDAEAYSPEAVANLLMRVGMQVGVGEGRPDSRKSCGLGWGTFELESDNGKKK